MVCNMILILSNNSILEMGHSKTFVPSSIHTISFRAVSLHLYTRSVCRCIIVHSWNCFVLNSFCVKNNKNRTGDNYYISSFSKIMEETNL